MNTLLMISVVMPIHNSAAYIERTLRCFCAQTYKDFELILVDDASSDNSEEILFAKLKQDNLNIRYFRLSQHRGASVARNYGAQHARGELLFFQDSDDIVDPNFLYFFQQEFEHSHYDVCFCNYRVIDERKSHANGYNIENHFIFTGHHSLYFNYLIGKTTLCHCAAAYRRDFLLQSSLHYTEGCQCAEDTEFLCKVLFDAKQISFIDKILYTYCRHCPSLSHSLPDTRILDAYKAMCRTQRSLPYVWRSVFALTKRARIHSFILEMFLKSDIPVPQRYCSTSELLICLILSSLFTQNAAKHRKVLSAYLNGQIKFED